MEIVLKVVEVVLKVVDVVRKVLGGCAALCVTRYCGSCGGRLRLLGGTGAVGVPEVLEVIRCVLLCMPEAVEGGLCLQEVQEVPEVIRCVLLCVMEAVEGTLCLLEVLDSGVVSGDTLWGAF